MILELGILCVIVLLGFSALIFLKHSLDRALLKDILEMRMDVIESLKKAKSCEELVSKLSHDFKADMTIFIEKFESIKSLTLESKMNTETILKEYEINGIPLGYQRGDHFDAIEGM